MTTLVDIASLRLRSQRLLAPLDTPLEVAQHFGCTQGQDYPGSTMSIALRSSDRTLAAVAEAYDRGDIVRSWPMRGTLFVVPAEDLGWMLQVTSEKLLRGMARRRAQLGIDDASLADSEQVARDALTGGGLPREALLARWEEAGLATSDGRGYHRIVNLALQGVICLGPTDGKGQRLMLTDEWIPNGRRLDREDAIALWFRRYVHSHGPVPVSDFLWWTKLGKRDVAGVLGHVRDEFEVIDVDGTEYWVDPEVLDAGTPPQSHLLLPGFDELVLGYGDRRAVLTPEQEKLVVPGNNGVFKPTLVVNGQAVGTWRRAKAGHPVDVTGFDPPLPAEISKRVPSLSTALPR